MKALLKTKCGCSRMITVPENSTELKIPIWQPLHDITIHEEALANEYVETRTFVLVGKKSIFGIDILVYEEK